MYFIALPAQYDSFIPIELLSTDKYSKVEGFHVSEVYIYRDLQILIGSLSDTDKDYLEFHMLILDSNMNVIFRSDGQMDSYYFSPMIYQSELNPDKFFIVSEIGSEYSWGAKVYYHDSDSIITIGHIDAAILEVDLNTGEYDMHPTWDYFDLKITAKGDSYIFEFITDHKIILFPGTNNERIMLSSQVWYEFNKEFEIIIKE